MKKLIIVTMVLALILPVAAIADLPDISGLSFDELVQLHDQLNLAMWNSNEWQEVKIPAGVWTVGEDIPSGHWIVRPMKNSMTQVYYCEKVREVEKLPDHDGLYHTIVIFSESTYLGETKPNEVDYDMKNGWYFICNDPVIFTPYSGKPNLGFH